MATLTVFNRYLLLLGGMISLSLFSCHPTSDSKNTLRVATAANMQFPMEQILSAFEASTGISCELITGSSGKLTSQILAGAPFDLFVSADSAYPDFLYQEGKTHGPPSLYAFGQLVFVNNRAGTTIADSLSIPNFLDFDKLAIANPETAPYGKVALEFLKSVGQYEAVKDRLVFGESINQTNQFISTGVVDGGITSQSVVFNEQVVLKAMKSWVRLDTTHYQSIGQAAVVLKNDRNQVEQARQLQAFLSSPDGKKCLTDFGYRLSF